jgi:CHAT domain-containing protein/Tfp pilus assembly protein PilF
MRRHDHNRKRKLPECARVGAPKLIVLVLAIAALTTCSRPRDPESAYELALQTFQHGDVKRSLEDAKNGYDAFHTVSADWRWRFRILEANALLSQQRGQDALTLFASEPGPPSSGDLAVQVQRIEGAAYAVTGNFSEAQKRLIEAEHLCVFSETAACSGVISLRGWLDMRRGDFLSAQRLFGLALASARRKNSQFLEANALLNLSWSALQLTHFDEALDWASDARQIAVPQDFAGIAQKALGNMGWAYYKLGDLEKAEGMFIEARNQAERLGEIASQAGWLIDAGYVDLDAGRLAAAQKTFEQSLKFARQISSRGDVVTALQALAFVFERTDKLEVAKRYADEALSMAQADKNGRDMVYARLVQGRVAARLNNAGLADSNFRFVEESKDTPVFLKWEAERSLARLYEDEKQHTNAEKEYRVALTTFEAARSELKHEDSRLPFLSNASRIYDDYVHFLVAQGKSIDALRTADYSRGRTLAEGLGLLQKEASFKPASFDTQEVARRAGGTILFYWLGEKQSYLWAITPQKTSLFSLPPGREIDASVRRYREALAGPQNVLTSADTDGQLLYRILITPAQALLKKDAKIFVIPDGSLNNLNFETLLVPDLGASDPKMQASNPPQPTLHYWIEDVTVANASSLRVLAAARAVKTKHDRSLLLVGNSVAPNGKYPELSQAAAQMQSVARHFPAAEETILTREAATPAAYLAINPQRFSYIHFVAHGTASRLSPLDSAIVLSKGSAEEDSFKLYARDIIRHPLHADLVTISACYSAGERSYTGEGLVGLSWGFLRAGALNVIAALWEATDASTELLMDRFYDKLEKGEDPDAALRDAKLSLLHNSGFRNPFYWAPFQLYARLGAN